MGGQHGERLVEVQQLGEVSGRGGQRRAFRRRRHAVVEREPRSHVLDGGQWRVGAPYGLIIAPLLLAPHRHSGLTERAVQGRFGSVAERQLLEQPGQVPVVAAGRPSDRRALVDGREEGQYVLGRVGHQQPLAVLRLGIGADDRFRREDRLPDIRPQRIGVDGHGSRVSAIAG